MFTVVDNQRMSGSTEPVVVVDVDNQRMSGSTETVVDVVVVVVVVDVADVVEIKLINGTQQLLLSFSDTGPWSSIASLSTCGSFSKRMCHWRYTQKGVKHD